MSKNKNWLYISILTLVVALTWVVVSAVTHLRKSTIPPDIERIASPLNPSIDMSLFDNLKNRQ